MTTTYASKKSAIETGIYFAGRSGEVKPEDLEGKPGIIQGALGSSFPDISNLFDAEDFHNPDVKNGKYNAMIYDITTSTNKKAQLGITSFRNGFNLWLIDQESGFCRRT